ncbi:hypothetical protein (plasmid) [Lactobacillus amylovorus GRL1118] [Lactiplantibacillus mudanjiangensis]|nr:hypothetical protein (plasmid) [Lactobacillus amylovorus GRL1118] [Lactiplantibacillus mudanjiangensis]
MICLYVWLVDVYVCYVVFFVCFFFFFKQKTAYEIPLRLVGSEMCIRDSATKFAVVGMSEAVAYDLQAYKQTRFIFMSLLLHSSKLI